ncbi:MAG: aspartate/glutamate racemase family protein [Rhodobacteraceae bacterium]|nr:aspartate/glutamate racemase family protein [Paracoccaceae bacterium]
MDKPLSPADMATGSPTIASDITLRPVVPALGAIWKARIGMIDLASGLTGEEEMHAIIPEDALLLTTRVMNSNTISLEKLSEIRGDLVRAAMTITPDQPLDVMIYCCTSGAIAMGEEELERLIQSVRPGVPVTNPFTAATEAFRHLGIERISFLAPYTPDVTAYMRAAFIAKGFEVMHTTTYGLELDSELGQVLREDIIQTALEQPLEGAQALFISCTALRVVSLIEQIETAIGLPVITSNQALAWHALRLAGYDRNLDGFGTLGMTITCSRNEGIFAK